MMEKGYASQWNFIVTLTIWMMLRPGPSKLTGLLQDGTLTVAVVEVISVVALPRRVLYIILILQLLWNVDNKEVFMAPTGVTLN